MHGRPFPSWGSHNKWLHKYRNVFSKNKSERMPIQKPYGYATDFVEGATLPKLAKV